MIEARRQPVAEAGENRLRLLDEQRVLVPHRARADKRGPKLRHGPQPRPRRLEPSVRANQYVVEHAEVGEYASVLESSRDPERRDPLRGEALDTAAFEGYRTAVGAIE